LASDRQIEANRRNARRSSGPRTPEGKAASRGNAVTHGLTARNIFLKGEDPGEYRRLNEAATAHLKPEGVLEQELVARMVSVFWRLRRVPAFEAALLAVLEQEQEEKDSFGLDLSGSYEGTAEEGEEADLKLGRTIKGFLSADFSGKLGRYETGLQKQLSALLHELRAMQERRLRESEASLPASRKAETG
jgi:hypothetical protein